MRESKCQVWLEACKQATTEFHQLSQKISDLHDPRLMEIRDRRGTPPCAKLCTDRDIPLVVKAHRQRIAAESAWIEAFIRIVECYDTTGTPYLPSAHGALVHLLTNP